MADLLLSPGYRDGTRGAMLPRRERPVQTLFGRRHATVPYDSIISRTDADVLIPTEQAEAVISAATQESAALILFNRAQLSTKVTRQPVMSALPVAYWVAGDTRDQADDRGPRGPVSISSPRRSPASSPSPRRS